MAEIFGSPDGYAGGRGGSQHMAVKEINFLGTHGITAGTIPLATGAALHKKLNDEPGVAVVFFGDGASSQGEVHEAMNMAGVFGAATVFICENNFWAISVPYAKQTAAATIAQKAVAYGIEGVRVDGMDTLAVYAVVKAAVDKARAGDGATLRVEASAVVGCEAAPGEGGTSESLGGGLLLVSQFTLAADTNKGNRPSFTSAAPPEEGLALFDDVVARARQALGSVATGEFGADMAVSLTNDGPVTIWMDF